MHRIRTLLLALLALLSFAAPGTADPRHWPPDFTTRVEALALIETLNAELLSHDSATLTLERWCAAHHLAPASEHVIAQRDRATEKTPTPDTLKLLAVTGVEAVRYRRVRLSCGGHVVSEADNWYVPARLTAAMNDVLERTDTSFGRVVQPLHFSRHTISSDLLWHPLPDGWEMEAGVPAAAAGDMAIPHSLLEHRAILTLPDGTPFSEVVETYTEAVLDFPLPPR